tara:strand:- start:356 stop:502 length:147 start_codon:yes stop_codon:yes gene_type:complete
VGIMLFKLPDKPLTLILLITSKTVGDIIYFRRYGRGILFSIDTRALKN